MPTARASQGCVADDPPVRVIAIESAADLELAHSIRRRVFIEEQNVPEEIELDSDDARAFHALAIAGFEVIGCGRMLDDGEHEVRIGRMAVLPEYRGTGVGRQILRFLMDEARKRGKRKAVLHAQMSAEGFYLKEGYTRVGEVFEEAGIAHRTMEKPL